MWLYLPKLPPTYWFFAFLRIALVFIPQHGYIHPDEFFQSTEVLAGKIFELESTVPWEFNATFPLRSVTLPYFTIGSAYRILNTLQFFLREYSIVTTYTLVVAPRLLISLLSFLVDFSLYKICSNNNEKHKSRMVVLASSYVTIVYATRTFSNTTELISFALLLYFVSESLIFSNILTKKREYLNYRYDMSTSTVDKAKFHKLKLYLTTDTLRNCIEVSSITVFGFFNRPTFVAFSLFPIFFWLYRGMNVKTVTPFKFHWRILVFLLSCIPPVLLNVIVDSFFYSHLTWGEIGVLNVTIQNFIFTPWNFLKYNLNKENLVKHGLHPRFLHALVNMPLLFGLLSFFAIAGLAKMFILILRGKHQLLPTLRSIKGLMILSYLAPLLILSLVPHQEPRFLIPLILPLVYLYGNSILPESENVVVSFTNKPKKITDDQSNYVLFKLWLVVNAILILFFGFVHQGGVYQAANYLSKDIANSPFTEYHVVTSHVYSIPQSFFLQKSSEKLYFAKNTKFNINKRIFLHEEGSKSLDQVIVSLKDIRKSVKKDKFKILLIIAGSMVDRLDGFKRDLKFVEMKSLYPHLSTEAFPNLHDDFYFFYENFQIAEVGTLLQYCFYKICSSFSLKVYQIHYLV